MSSSIDTLYICSAGHSGSTLIDLILGSHSRVESLGEVAFVPSSLVIGKTCSCGAAMTECGHWRGVIECLNRKHGRDYWRDPRSLNLGLILGHRNVDFERLTRWYVTRWKLQHALRAAEIMLGAGLFRPLTGEFRQGLDNTFDFYDCAREVSGKPVVVDSSKQYIKGISLYLARPQRVRLILVTRDGRGVMHSHLKRGVSRDYARVAWGNYYRRVLPLLEKAVPEAHVLRVKYEDLAANPDGMVRRMCEFAGLAFEPAMLDFANHPHHITEGNDMRSSGSSEIRLSTAWQKELERDDLDFFERHLGAVNRALGY